MQYFNHRINKNRKLPYRRLDLSVDTGALHQIAGTESPDKWDIDIAECPYCDQTTIKNKSITKYYCSDCGKQFIENKVDNKNGEK